MNMTRTLLAVSILATSLAPLDAFAASPGSKPEQPYPGQRQIPNTNTKAAPGEAALCFTCGGVWPVHTGTILLPAPGHAVEFGANCSDPLQEINDQIPYLCTR